MKGGIAYLVTIFICICVMVLFGNAKYTKEDAYKVLQYCAGTVELTEYEYNKYDLNNDGKIGTGDAVLILREVQDV